MWKTFMTIKPHGWTEQTINCVRDLGFFIRFTIGSTFGFSDLFGPACSCSYHVVYIVRCKWWTVFRFGVYLLMVRYYAYNKTDGWVQNVKYLWIVGYLNIRNILKKCFFLLVGQVVRWTRTDYARLMIFQGKKKISYVAFYEVVLKLDQCVLIRATWILFKNKL